MTEIGFYHLFNWPLERALPRLLEKVLGQGHRVVILIGSKQHLEDLDNVLWTYEEKSWLPHGSAKNEMPEEQPIYLTLKDENPNGADVLVTIDGCKASDTNAFARIIDMFNGGDETLVEMARQRWRYYLDQGHNLIYWQQNEAGGWNKKTLEEG